MKTSPRLASGFTLLEILVVLTIVGVLASVLLVVFVRVREQGRRTTCANNLHQIGLAFQQYIGDNNTYYPPLQYHEWSDALQPYLKSYHVFDCPSHTERYPKGQIGKAAMPQLAGDYDYNWYNIRNSPKQPYNADKSENLMSAPQETAVVFDAGWIDSVDSSKHYLQSTGIYEKHGLSSQMYRYSAHDGGANFLFADWHVQWLSAQQQTNLSFTGGWVDPPPGDS